MRYPTGESPAGGSQARVTPVAVVASRRRFCGGLSAVVVGSGVNDPGVATSGTPGAAAPATTGWPGVTAAAPAAAGGTNGVPVAADAPAPTGPWAVLAAGAAAATAPPTTTARVAFC